MISVRGIAPKGCLDKSVSNNWSKMFFFPHHNEERGKAQREERGTAQRNECNADRDDVTFYHGRLLKKKASAALYRHPFE